MTNQWVNMTVTNKDIVIFGFGGLARELWGWIRNSTDGAMRARISAFVVDGELPADRYDGVPVITRAVAAGQGPKEYLLAVADPASRRRLSAELDGLGWVAGRYVHESAMLGINLSIGIGTIVFPRCSLSSDTIIGDHVLVNGGTAIGHDCVIGRYTSLLGGISVNGNVSIGESVLIGAGAIIYPGRKIGSGATVGMGSVVFRDVAPGQTVYGNPAKALE
jgi:acetyltransferase EpsM